MRRALLFALLILSAAGCGQESVSDSPPAEGPGTTRVTLYFLAEDGSISLGVRRDVLQRVPPPWGSTAGGALEALLAGPTAEEAAAGFTTAIPRGTRLISLRSHGYSGTGAVVNLSGLDRVADSLDRAGIITQIVRTLATRVWLLEEGELWGMYLMDGGVDNGPFDYDTLLGFHLGVACPGTGTVECDRFDALP
jgi:Sporulation and spore germination